MPAVKPSLGPTTVTHEGGGYVVSCACLWLKFAADEQHAAKYRREHEKTCAKCKAVAE